MDHPTQPSVEPVDSAVDASYLEPIDEAELARVRDLPWIVRLDAGDLAQLVAEYEGALRESYRSGDNAAAESVLSAWKRKVLERT